VKQLRGFSGLVGESDLVIVDDFSDVEVVEE